MKLNIVALLATICPAAAFVAQAPMALRPPSSSSLAMNKYPDQTKKVWDEATRVIVQGGSLKTWSYPASQFDKLQVVLKTEGRPMDADIELWSGPDNNPVKMRVHSEDASLRPFSAVIATTARMANTIKIKNIGSVEFPLTAAVSTDAVDTRSPGLFDARGGTIQGNTLKTYPFDATVGSVHILLETDGRPLNARIDVLQGPSNKKVVVDLYTEDGMGRPIYLCIDCPGAGHVIQIKNTGDVVFPLTASVEGNSEDNSFSDPTQPVMGGSPTMGGSWF